jgi:hypothetical protein
MIGWDPTVRREDRRMGAFKKIVFVGALAAAGAVIAKKLMDSSDSNAWESAGGWDSTPSTDWSRKAADSASTVSQSAQAAADTVAEKVDEAADTVADTAEEAAEGTKKKAEKAADSVSDAADQAEAAADAAAEEADKQ